MVDTAGVCNLPVMYMLEERRGTYHKLLRRERADSLAFGPDSDVWVSWVSLGSQVQICMCLVAYGAYGWCHDVHVVPCTNPFVQRVCREAWFSCFVKEKFSVGTGVTHACLSWCLECRDVTV